MQDPAALGRAGRLEVPPRRAPHRRDPRGGGRDARPPPNPAGRPLVGLRERARGESPHGGILFDLTAAERLPLRPILRLAESSHEVRQPAGAEHLPDGLRLAQMEPIVVGGAVQLGPRRHTAQLPAACASIVFFMTVMPWSIMPAM